MADKVQKTEEEWRKELTPEQYRVLRQKGTERPFSGEYETVMTPGVYKCAACGQELFLVRHQVRRGLRLAEFLSAAGGGQDRRPRRQHPGHAPRRSDLLPLRRTPGTRLSRWPEADRIALLHQLGVVEDGPEIAMSK